MDRNPLGGGAGGGGVKRSRIYWVRGVGFVGPKSGVEGPGSPVTGLIVIMHLLLSGSPMGDILCNKIVRLSLL